MEARDLVQQMLERDPDKRISAKDALQHPWIVNRTSSSDVTPLMEGLNIDDNEVVDIAMEEGAACTIC